ncbi:MAG: putative metalloprotease YhfN [Isosphaeraceae bacterium]|nr:MAG: putative metalloprotease YhfN [Isosphaeraceae bacterium]
MRRARVIAIWLILMGAGLIQAAAASDRPDPAPDASVAVPEPTPRAVHYYYTGLGLWVARKLWAFAVPVVWIVGGAAAALGRKVRRLPYLAAVFAFTGGYELITALLNLPWTIYLGFLRPRDYGLGTQPLGDFLADQLKSLALGLVLTWAAVGGVYFLLRRYPRRWWIWAGLAVVPISLGLTFVVPIWIDPLFHEYGPLADRKLEAQILELAARVGAGDAEVYQVDMSRETRAVNAYVTGLLGTKRIVLWDTLLERLAPDEVLAVVGHELGHYVLNHVPLGVLVGSGLTFIGLGAVATMARRVVPTLTARYGITRLDEPASLPVLLLLAQAVSFLLMPIGYAVSRRIEHEADRFALELTHDNNAAARAFVALQQTNLGYPRPGLLSTLLRSSHPSLADRIEFCNRYRPWSEGRPLAYERFLNRSGQTPSSDSAAPR